MEFVDTARDQLLPLTRQVLEALDDDRFSQAQRLLIDQLLEAAEDIALTLSVSPDQAH